jgi:SsrA-binding protein
MKKKPKTEVRIDNRKARFDYEFLEKWVAGIMLVGTEVKSIREGRATLVDAYCSFVQHELWLHQMVITPLVENGHDPRASRKLLLNKSELKRIEKGLVEGTTLVVTRLFTMNGRIKAEIALARGKKNYDKRETIKARDIDRETKRETNM